MMWTTLTALFSPRVWIVLALSVVLCGTHWKAYTAGEKAIQADWNAERITQAQETAKAVKVAHDKEVAYQSQIIEAQNDATKRNQTLKAAADSARAESLSLRDELSAARASLPKLADDAVRKYADAASIVFSECSDALTGMAKEADGHSSDSLMLQQAWPK